jgi:hypothetical protein
MNAATSDHDAPAPAPVASRYRVPWWVRNSTGSKCSPGRGDTESRTRGSARDDRARETPIQMESRVRGSAWIIASSESAQPGARLVLLDRIATASAAAEGDSVQANSSPGVR